MSAPAKPASSSLLLSGLFVVLGFVALAHTVTGNLWFGMSLAQSEPAQYWQGGSAVFIDIMVAALAGACGWLFSRRRFVASAFVGILAGVFAIMSALSLVGLGAMERVAKARGIEAANLTAKESAADRNVFLAGAHERNLSWLRQQAADKRLSRVERRELRNELIEASKTGPAAIEARVEALMADPQAEFLAELSGIPVDKVQVFFVAALAILLIVGKTVSFWLAGYFARIKTVSDQPLEIVDPQHAPVLSNTSNEIKTMDEVGGGLPPVDNSSEVDKSQLAVEDFSQSTTGPEESSTEAVDNEAEMDLDPEPPTAEENENEVRRLGAVLRQTISKHVFDETILVQFLAECTRIQKGRRVGAHHLYTTYVRYAQENNYSVLTQNQFGRLCSDAGLQRISSRRGVDYINLALVDKVGAEEVAQAVAA